MSRNVLSYSVTRDPSGGIRVILTGCGIQRDNYVPVGIVDQVYPAGLIDAECYAFNAMLKACAYPVTGLMYA